MGRLLLSRRTRAVLTVFVGGAVFAAGVALVYVPAGVIAAGVLLVGAGLLLVDVDEPKERR